MVVRGRGQPSLPPLPSGPLLPHSDSPEQGAPRLPGPQQLCEAQQ